MKRKAIPEDKVECEVGSGNVFADLGFDNSEEELLKADLTAEIASLIKKQRMTQKRAAELLGVDQPRISALLRGKLSLFSVEMLMRFLNALGQDIEVVVKPKPRNRKQAHLVAHTHHETRAMVPMAAKAH